MIRVIRTNPDIAFATNREEQWQSRCSHILYYPQVDHPLARPLTALRLPPSRCDGLGMVVRRVGEERYLGGMDEDSLKKSSWKERMRDMW